MSEENSENLEEKTKIYEISLGINDKKRFMGVKDFRHRELANKLYDIMNDGKCNSYDQMVSCIGKIDKSLIIYNITNKEKEFYETLQKEGVLLIDYIKTNNERFIPEGLKRPDGTKLDKIEAKQCLKLCYDEIKRMQEEHSIPDNDVINKIKEYISYDSVKKKEIIFETEDDRRMFQEKESTSEKEKIKYRKNFSNAF